MQIMKALIAIEGETGTVHQMDVISHDGHLWLVPYWLDNHAERFSTPVRIIRLDSVPHSATGGNPQFVIHDPMPKAVIEGHAQLEAGQQFVVVEGPNIRSAWLN